MEKDDFEESRKRLLAKEQELLGAIAHLERSERISEETGVQDYGDRAASDYNRESLFQQLEQERTLLTAVRDALRRLAGGSYALCTNCGKHIEAKRLQVVPWTSFCHRCQERKDLGLL
jgi:DnaK suppressor protein